MKSVYIIANGTTGIRGVESFLTEINAHHVTFRTPDEAIDSDEKPDLVVIMSTGDLADFRARFDSLKGDRIFSRIPRVLVQPREFSAVLQKTGDFQGETLLNMPLDKLEFLSSISRLLKIPHRRVFNTVISVQPDGGNIRYSGVSQDFSETGMAFECSADLPKEQKIRVSFIDPKSKQRLVLSARIARKRSDILNFYGAVFVNLTADEKTGLLRFLTGSA